MQYFFSMLLLSAITCCQLQPGQHKNSLTGKWKLTRYYADIGDGKEHWQQASGNMARTIEFKQNGTFVTPEQQKAGRYTLPDSIHINIMPGDSGAPYTLTIVKLTADTLTVRANCIEGCGEIYQRIR